MPHLFEVMELRKLKIKNRVGMSPMCQYTAKDGVAQAWHMSHLGARASGGVGLVIVEATGVSPEARISPGDLGLWNETQMLSLKPIVEFIHTQGATSAIQLAHAGRKASVNLPWKGGNLLLPGEGGWSTVAPSALAYDVSYSLPEELSEVGMKKVASDFLHSVQLALRAGFQVVEIHMAHGYLLHEFLSPLSNQRRDQFGGSLENRMRFPLKIAKDIREFWPQDLPVFVRISATDWAEGGWDLSQSIEFCAQLKKIGIDLIDVSSGGLVPHQKINLGPLYQVPFAQEIKAKVNMPVAAVGLITEAQQAEKLILDEKADVVLLGRELLRNPFWPLHAAQELQQEVAWPPQYLRGK